MEEKEYSVSEAVRLVGVESHVLRYWEEELQVEIRRTSQGHRIYSESDIRLFCRVRELKEQGIQLRAIRVLLAGTRPKEPDGPSDAQTADADLLQSIRRIEAESGRRGEAEARRRIEAESGRRGEAETDRGNEMEAVDLGEQESRHAQREEKGAAEYERALETAFREDRAEYGGNAETAFEKIRSNAATAARQESEDEAECCETAGTVFEEDETPNGYELVVDEKQDNLRQFELILKRLIAEVMEEQNKKLERALEDAVRAEVADLYQAYQDTLREAAASREAEGERGLRGLLRALLHRR